MGVRYACVRKQGFKDSQASSLADSIARGEHTVMDYRNLQYRVFKAIGMAYMFHWNFVHATNFLSRVQKGVMKSDKTAAMELPELHITLCGLKVASTVAAHNQIEECRRDCGGQGYMTAAAIGEIGTSFAVASTGEGDRTILNLQVARFLIKSAHSVSVGKSVGEFMSYLNDSPEGLLEEGYFDVEPASVSSEFPSIIDRLIALLRSRASRLAWSLKVEFDTVTATGRNFDAALNEVSVLGYKAADAHSWYIMARNTATMLPERVQDPAIRAVLVRLLELQLTQYVYENMGDWIGVMHPAHSLKLLRRISARLIELRPDAVALTDGFGHTDHDLHYSTLGSYHGNVYEAIYNAAKKSPLNAQSKMVGWDAFSEMLDLDFIREGMKSQRVLEQSRF